MLLFILLEHTPSISLSYHQLINMVHRTSTADVPHVMSMDLSPKKPNKAYGSDGGAYYDWSPADLPMLGAASIGAAKLCLSAGGLALPSYSDSA